MIAVCKKIYDKEGSTTVAFPYLKAPFEAVIITIKSNNNSPLKNIYKNITMNNNTLNKIHLCTRDAKNEWYHFGACQFRDALNEVLNYRAYFALPYSDASESTKLVESIVKVSAEELILIKKADEVALFFSYIESKKIAAAVGLLQQKPELAGAYNATQGFSQDYTKLSPLETISRLYGNDPLEGEIQELAKLLIIYGSDPLIENSYMQLSGELQKLVQSCASDKNLFKTLEEKISSSNTGVYYCRSVSRRVA